MKGKLAGLVIEFKNHKGITLLSRMRLYTRNK